MTQTAASPATSSHVALKRRSPGGVFFFPIITLGIYFIYWFAKTRGELKASGETIPTTWCYIVPILNFVWLFWLARAITNVTHEGTAGGKWWLIVLLGPIGMAIVQSGINKSL
jgi:hypothetical protein